jgi:hypothetical protein
VQKADSTGCGAIARARVLTAGGEDFMLIESMNTAAGRQYREMAKYASGLVAVMDSLREKRARAAQFLCLPPSPAV